MRSHSERRSRITQQFLIFFRSVASSSFSSKNLFSVCETNQKAQRRRGQGAALATVVSDSSTVVSSSGRMVWMDVGEDLILDVVIGFAKYYVGYFLLPFRLFFSSFKSWVIRELVCYVRVHLSIQQYFFFKIFCYTLVLELEMSSILFP